MSPCSNSNPLILQYETIPESTTWWRWAHIYVMMLYQVMTLNTVQCGKMIGRHELGWFSSESLNHIHIAGSRHRLRSTRCWTCQALNSWPLKIGSSETSVRNYHFTLGNTVEESRSNLRDGGSLKSRKWRAVLNKAMNLRFSQNAGELLD